LLGVALPEGVGGLGLGLVELALVCAEQGRVVAPVPFVWNATAAMAVAMHGSPTQQDEWLAGVVTGDVILTAALPHATGQLRIDGGVASGTVPAVPYAHVADAVLLPVGDQLYIVRPRNGRFGRATSREVYAEVTLDGEPAEPLGGIGSASWLWQRTLVALAGVQIGVTAGALRMAADYTSGRKQFGKPLSSFQGVALKAADGYIDNAAIRSTAMQAAWHLDQDSDDADLHVLSAAWWAADGGQHCVHLTQHVHGGIGADVTYPIHRYFLWGKQIEILVGGASAIAASLGEALIDRPDAGDAIST
jgi:acyl-CoA dehydrogenase